MGKDVLLCDFGLTQERLQTVKNSRGFIGTARYSSPEASDDSGNLRPQTDTYSFTGILFWQKMQFCSSLILKTLVWLPCIFNIKTTTKNKKILITYQSSVS